MAPSDDSCSNFAPLLTNGIYLFQVNLEKEIIYYIPLNNTRSALKSMNTKNTNNRSFISSLRKPPSNPEPPREPQKYTGRKKYFSEYTDQTYSPNTLVATSYKPKK